MTQRRMRGEPEKLGAASDEGVDAAKSRKSGGISSRKVNKPDGNASVKGPEDRVGELEARVVLLEERIQWLEAATDTEEQDVTELRTLTREQAKQEILALFQSEETLYYSDIARNLAIDLPLVVEICQELEEEEEIGIDADAL